MMKQPNTPTLLIPIPTAIPTFTLINCGQCGVDARPFLHHIHHHGLFRRLCTACLLRANSHAFCPTCFTLHDPRAQLNTTPCTKCGSVSHTLCLGENPSKENYICPLCTAQFSPIFGWKSGGSNGGIDRKSAAALLAAAKISYDSMSKAACVAKLEADKKVKEANFTRKRAKEALDHVANVSEKLENEAIVGNVGSVGNGVIGFGGNVGERSLFDRVDNSSAVLAAFNAVDLREKGRQDGGVNGNGMLGVGMVSMGVGGNGNGLSNGNGREVVPVLEARPIAAVYPFVQNGHPREGNGGVFQ
ncbi:uncharacterized protein LOC141665318 [Apium graveolens]|uniref:uncharacterized protein LOC141665318 n=1 Tax=Apium graveolens TaxID=4045 RepID=UPI003D798119